MDGYIEQRKAEIVTWEVFSSPIAKHYKSVL